MLQRPRRRCEGTAIGAIVLDLRPGFGIGPFSLVMTICEAFAHIELQPNIYDVVHVKYLDERLRLIEIFDVKRIQLQYATSLTGGHSTQATFVAVYAVFGPTFPGVNDKERGVYFLICPALSFVFPIPTQYSDCIHDGEELPLEFSGGTTPVTCRASVYDSSTDTKVGIRSKMGKAAPAPPAGSSYMEEVRVKLGEELWFTVGGQLISFGASPQDIWTELGRPCGIHQKQLEILFMKEIPPNKASSTKWEQVKEILGDCGRAAIQIQGSTSNPFGLTFVYAYQNVAFELRGYEE